MQGGSAVAVPEPEIESMQAYAATFGVGFVSLETAAALAALPLLKDSGLIEAEDRIALFDTGAGFKSAALNVELPSALQNDPGAWEELISSFS